MKRAALLGALLVAVLVCGYAISTPEPAHAILCCDNGGYETPHHWHMASTCSDAQAQHRALSLPEAQAFCGGATKVCGFTLPPCYASGAMWVVDGPATFSCRWDECTIEPY
jgi:hypothetical protein